MTDDRRVARWIGVCALLFYLPFFHGHFYGTDETSIYQVGRALYKDGTLAVTPAPHHFEGRDGRLYSWFAVGQSVGVMPLYGLGQLARATLPESWQELMRGRVRSGDQIDTLANPEIFSVALYSPIATAFLVAVFFRLERRLGVSLRSALLASAVFATATYGAALSVYLLRHATEAIVLLGGLYFFVDWRRSGSLRSLALGSGIACATVLVRVPSAFALPPLGGYVLWSIFERREPARWKALLVAAGPALLVAAVHVGINQAKWGTWIGSPALDQTAIFFNAPLYVGLAGFLLSPGAGIFFYSPPLLMLPWTLPRFFRAHRVECVAVLAVCASVIVLCSGFDLWTGLWSAPGPRLVFVVVPLLMLPLGLWLDASESRGLLLLLGGLTAVGIAVQVVLMAARWSRVIASMGYQEYQPLMGYVFVPEMSPILGSAWTVGRGEIDAWLWGLWHGWPGRPGSKLGALTIAALWAGSCGLAVWRLIAAARRPADPR